MSALPPLALVTGGCHRLGAALSAHLARAGYSLALHGHSNAEPEADLATTLCDTGADWRGFRADFGESGEAERLFAAVTGHFGRPPDLLVNNASIFGQDDISDLNADSLNAHMTVNLAAPVLLTQAMQRQADTGSAVVMILDQRVRNPGGDQLSYTLSKQALAAAVRSLAAAAAPHLRVNGIAPGLTLATADYSAAQLDRLAAMMPLERLSRPDDIAAALLYLATAEAVTGQILYVDGGANMKSFDRDFMHLAKGE